MSLHPNQLKIESRIHSKLTINSATIPKECLAFSKRNAADETVGYPKESDPKEPNECLSANKVILNVFHETCDRKK